MSWRSLARLVILFAAAAIVLPSAFPAVAQPETPIRIGVTAGDAFAEAYYAQDLGLFKKAGLRAELRPFSNGAAISTGMTSGTIDVGISNGLNVARATARGVPFVLIAGGGMYSASSPIVALGVPRTSTIRSAADLEGKTIAITALGDLAQVGVTAWMDRAGANPSKVHFIEITFADMQAALDGKLADAAVITEPWASAGLRSGKMRVLARPYDAIGSQFLVGVWFTTSSWYAKNRELAKRFVDVIYAAGKWGNSHPRESAQILAAHSKIDLQTIRSMARAPYASSLDPSLMQPQLNLAYRYHIIARPIDVTAIIAK